LWLDASDFASITITSGKVSQWNDKSGNARNSTQPTAAQRPTYTASGISSLPMLRFVVAGGNFNFMQTYKFATVTTNWSFFTVHSIDSITVGTNFVYGCDSSIGYNSNGVYAGTNATVFNRTGAAQGVGSSGTVTANAMGCIGCVYSITPNNNAYVSYNGSVGSAVNNLSWTNGSLSYYALGCYGPGSGAAALSNSLNGYIAEHIAIPYSLSADQVSKMEGYLAWKWLFVDKLPSDHPYKSAPPTI
jgi:hypothetical protein